MDPISPNALREQVLKELEKPTADPAARLKACTMLVFGHFYDDFAAVARALSEIEDTCRDHPFWCLCSGLVRAMGHASGDPIPLLEKAQPHLANLVQVFHGLAWAHLQNQSYVKALQSCSDGLNRHPDNGHLKALLPLTASLVRGEQETQFTLNSVEYAFHFFTSNTQEIEAALTHKSGKLTEPAELRMILEHVGEVDSVAEIGCLVGNHSTFFLKNLKPSRMTIIDASQTSLAHTKVNLALNLADDAQTRIDYIHCALGRETGTVEFFNCPTPLDSLGNLLDQHYDFIKIDVDGMEMEALEGARTYLQTYRPKVMIEVLHLLHEPFLELIEALGFAVIDSHEHPGYSNYLIGPIET